MRAYIAELLRKLADRINPPPRIVTNVQPGAGILDLSDEQIQRLEMRIFDHLGRVFRD